VQSETRTRATISREPSTSVNIRARTSQPGGSAGVGVESSGQPGASGTTGTR
jgi:hypothetical protein